MTEEEWLASITPIPMLEWLTPRYHTRNRYRYRTALLFGLACCERVVEFRGNAENWILRRAEELADGIPDAEPHITQAHVITAGRSATLRHLRLLLEPAARFAPHAVANAAAQLAVSRRRYDGFEPVELAFRAEETVQAGLLREVVGSPFRRTTFAPEWLTDTAVSLARGMYDARDFSAMPILADALQDAGCDNTDILNHCRDADATHVRGCWVVDLVLGKA